MAKHSKYKNTGILFELLVRQVTADILSSKSDSKANGLLQKYFSESTDLGKELKLYQLILQEKAKDSSSAEKLLEIIIKARKKLSSKKLNEQKYNLIKEIKENYPIDDFLRAPIQNYKMVASICKIFEEAVSEKEYFDPKEIFQARSSILESICSKVSSKPLNEKDKDELLEHYQKQENDLRLMSYKILVDSFNKKYSNLDENQKILLREYINNISNTNSLRQYIDKQIPLIKKQLNELGRGIEDQVIKIKLSEAINQLDKVSGGTLVKDNHVQALLLSYELLKELKQITKK